MKSVAPPLVKIGNINISKKFDFSNYGHNPDPKQYRKIKSFNTST